MGCSRGKIAEREKDEVYVFFLLSGCFHSRQLKSREWVHQIAGKKSVAQVSESEISKCTRWIKMFGRLAFMSFH